MSQISVGLNTLQELVISSLENLRIQSLTKSVELNSGRTEMQEHKGGGEYIPLSVSKSIFNLLIF